MTFTGASLVLDAAAMAELDRWLALDDAGRSTLMARLATADPALHARLRQLVAADAGVDASALLAAPLAQAIDDITAPALHAGQLIAGWRLITPLGRGGMAWVWLAERADRSLKRQVALKLPLAAQPSPRLAERFARERDVLAQLAHPHIARLYDAGMAADGRLFIVLEHVAGLPITQFADAHHLDLHQRLRLFNQVLAAVDHAHRHLVVHRDLKPSNILVDDDGQVKLLDFGIAKLLDAPADAAGLTQAHDAVMTPRYAAPEQIDGSTISTATDVYAAGVVLYELLTGRTPHGQGDVSVPALTLAILHDDPAPPSRVALAPALRRQLAGRIDTVVLKALRKAPAERYASAERFAEDLRRLLADEPILATRAPPWQRAALLVRRNRVASAALGLCLVVGIAAALWAWQQQQRLLAQQARTATVQRFLVQTLGDVEPDDQQDPAGLSGRALVDAALARAQADYAADPLLLGQLLGEIGRVYGRLNLDAPARQTLGQAVQLLSVHAPPADPALNAARVNLAGMLWLVDPATAQQQARTALTACHTGHADCAQVRSMAHSSLVQLLVDADRETEAATHARLAVQEARAGFTPDAPDLADALWSEAAVLRILGDFNAATAAVDEALAIGQRRSLKAGLRNGLLRMQAVLSVDLGRHELALAQLRQLQGRAASSYERAIQWRQLARVHWLRGDGAAMLHAAEQSLALALADGDARGAQLATVERLQALALLGQAATAVQQAQQLLAGLVAGGLQPHTLVHRRASKALAEAQLRAGQLDAADATLQQLLARHAPGRPPHGPDHADALDLQGCLARAQGDRGRAATAHAEAGRLLAAALPPEHPARLRNAVYTSGLGQGQDAATAQDRAWQQYTARLPAQAVWRDLARRLAPGSAAVAAGPVGCLPLG